jgi:type I restriction-modification system DNA methylase subunit
MSLSWNEIKTRATVFANEWKDEVSEDAEAKSFWDDFFNVFGISRRRVASFEQQVKKLDNKTGFIDLLWKGMILIEHKSRGKDLTKAYQQAKDYFPGLKEKELPRYILVSDFERFNLYDLEINQSHQFALTEFVQHVHLFGFIAGYEKRVYKEQDPVNIEAAALMGKLHDKLKAIGYEGHALELYLVRLLFCLFSDDTNIFEKGILHDYIDLRTNEDGSDLAAHIGQLFDVLNTPKPKRFSNLDENLAAFPYVNGKLFEERLPTASFDSEMRKTLLDCCMLDWGKISPAIFGSMFQSVMNPKERRNLGAHYTSEKNIMKLIKPLFLDDLWKEFEQAKDSKPKLQKLHEKISRLRFLDPACGCGNFLIIAYRELRLLEMEIVKTLLKGQTVTDISYYFLLDVDQFYGIEYEEFPAQIAQVAMWLIDHQMNMKASETFGEYYVRLPLRKSATIRHGNALRMDWQSLLTKETDYTVHTDLANIIMQEEAVEYKTVNVYAKEVQFIKADDIKPAPLVKFDFILGNPPFIGKSLMNAAQKSDMDLIFNGVNGAGVLDYVSAWYLKAATYMNDYGDNKTKAAFVSTNSISQGEQVGILWNELFNKYKIKIHFAHRTFSWRNEAKGNAAVHVIIIGFSNFDISDKFIYDYEDIKSEPHEIKSKNINPYLVEGKDEFVIRRKQTISNVPELIKGNQPTDDGNYLFTTEQKKSFLEIEPEATKLFKRFMGSSEFINNIERWCLWLKDVSPNELKHLPQVYERVQRVRAYRLKSTKAATVKKAETPALFDEIRHTGKDYLIIPEVSSERRKFLPIGYANGDVISSNKNYMLPNATLYHFGILNSTMHNVWTQNVSGRLKSDIQYSNGIVYNNFPWPENPTDKQKETVEAAAKAVLDARTMFSDASLADLYDPNTMPPVLVKAHQALDKAVDLCYRPQPFINETKRIEFLFELYDKYTSGMFKKEKKKK